MALLTINFNRKEVFALQKLLKEASHSNMTVAKLELMNKILKNITKYLNKHYI